METQSIVVLKGIGVDTYECHKNNFPQEADNSEESNQLRNRTRRYLKGLRSSRVGYVEKSEKRKRGAAMQSMPLVCGDSVLWSKKWVEQHSVLRERWQANQEAHGRSFDKSYG
jgi:hypothetical protein